MAKKTSTVALVVAILQLAFGVFGICGSVTMLPVVQQKIAEPQAGATQQAYIIATSMRLNATYAAVMFAGVLLYPILVLILLLLPGVGAAFHGKARAEEPEDYDDRSRED